MDCQESKRIRRVLHDAIDGLKLLSHVTEEWLETPRSMQHHGLMKAISAHYKNHHKEREVALIHSALNLLRILRDSEARAVFEADVDTPSILVSNAIEHFEKLAVYIHKQLNTTVEEEIANSANSAAIKDREQRAIVETEQLDQLLVLQRSERMKQQEGVLRYESSIRTSLSTIEKEFEENKALIMNSRDEERSVDNVQHMQTMSMQQCELAALQEALRDLRQNHAEAVNELRGKQRRAQEDIENIFERMEAELNTLREKETELLDKSHLLQTNISETTLQLDRLVKERMDHEESVIMAAEEIRQKKCLEMMRSRAARRIQSAWRTYQFKCKTRATVSRKKKSKKSKKKK